eukprot:7036754-Alexandrium_andersonii.AAC.1
MTATTAPQHRRNASPTAHSYACPLPAATHPHTSVCLQTTRPAHLVLPSQQRRPGISTPRHLRAARKLSLHTVDCHLVSRQKQGRAN